MSLGALVLHGFTGTPATVAPIVDAFTAAGIVVSAPTLPGHGTVIDDMVPMRWRDWTGAVEDALDELSTRPNVERVAVAGTSMGGTLALWLAGRHPEIAGLVLVNPQVEPQDDDIRQFIHEVIDAGEEILPRTDSDIADPDADEEAYEGTPLRALLSVFDGIDELQPVLPAIRCPVLLFTSIQDHVLDPAHSDHLASVLRGPVERVYLERSYHVATLDYDKDLIASRTVSFFRSLSN